MRYPGDDGGMRGAASRYDRWGTRRGSPYAADAGYDDPPAAGGAWTGGAGGGWSGSVNRWDEGADAGGGFGSADGRYGSAASGYGSADSGFGASDGFGSADGGWSDGGWVDDDGYDVQSIHLWGGPWLPPRVWARWGRRPWFPRLHGMLRRARPIGTLRRRGTGERLPVFRGRMGGRSWRVVTRPRGMRFEVVGLEAETGDEPLAADGIDAMGGIDATAGVDDDGASGGVADAAGDGGWTSAGPALDDGGGYRLRLPHAGLHTILGRLRPEQLQRLTGGPLPADPAAAVARGVGRVARRARRLGRFRGAAGGPRLDVFGAPGFRMLVRPTGELEGEILAVTPVEGEMENEEQRSIQGTMTWYGPYRFVLDGPEVLTTLPKGPPLLHADGKGVYLVEKRGNAGFVPVYVGKGDTTFRKRLGDHRDTLRRMKVDLSRYRVFLGIPSAATTPADLFALEHAVVRAVSRGVRGASASATDAATARAITSPLTTRTPRVPFKVVGAGLRLIHKQAPGHVRPAYLRTGTGAPGQYYELPD